MRILALSPTFHPLVGGAETALDQLFRRLAAKGHIIDVVTPRHGGPALETVVPGYRVVRVGFTLRSRPAKFLRYQWWQWRAARALHREARYDLAFLAYGVHASLIQPLIRRGLGLPVVIEEIHLGTGAEIAHASENPRIVGPLLRRSYQAADAVVAQSRDTGRFVEEASGRRDWVLIPLGTDPEKFAPHRRDEALRAKLGSPEHLLVTASRLSARKNIGSMLEAMSLVAKAESGAHLAIAGDGPERARLEAEARRLGLADRVTFLGYVDDGTLATLLASADVFLSTARYEAFGLSIVDAMASGIPIVAYDARGPNDYLHDGDAGLVTAHDPKLLSDAVLRLLASPVEAREMGRRGRAIVEKTYNWRANADAHEALFERIARRGPGGA